MDVHLHLPAKSLIAADATARKSADVAVLTRRMVEGDEMAYRMFYDAYFDRLSRYLLVVTGGKEDATRDALQATLVRVVRYIKVFPTEAAFWGWLTVLARSALADESRRRRRYLAFLDRFTQHSRIEHAARNEDRAEERLRLLLERQVALLPPEERQLVDWKYSARRSVREIAEELRTTEKAVESRLSRVRARLKRAVLAGLNHHDPAG